MFKSDRSAVTASAALTDDPFFDEILANPVARAAFEDAQARSSFIDALVKLRRAMHLTQTQVARRMGVTQPTVSGFENEGSDPRLSTVQRYARAIEADANFKLSMPAHVDWIPRNDSYAPVVLPVARAVEHVAATERATYWSAQRRADRAGAYA